jgi:class 3 adenylate cyclase
MTEERARRKLSGILSADAVGYSRLMQDDEASTIRTLAGSKELMTNLIQQYRGRVVDAPGDNLLAEFGSVVDAIECAVKIQQELKATNEELPDNRKMQFRIGVNLGDIVEEADHKPITYTAMGLTLPLASKDLQSREGFVSQGRPMIM